MLRRSLVLRSLVAASVSIGLASSVYPAAVQAAGAAGGSLVWVAIMLGGVVCILSALNFAVLSDRFPSAGGVQVYVRQAFGQELSISVTLLYIMLTMAAGAAEAYVFAGVLTQLFRALHQQWLATLPAAFWATVVLVFFYGLNLLGVEIAARTQEILTYTMVVLLIAFTSFVLLSHPAVGAPVRLPRLNVSGLGTAVVYSIYMYLGFEWITPLSEEAKNKKNIGRAMILAIILLAVCYSLFALALTESVPINSALLNSRTPHLVFGRAVAGPWGLAVMGAVSVMATLTSSNAGILGVSRLIYAMAREGVIPRSLSKINMRFFTPWYALVFSFFLQLLITLSIIASGMFKIPILLAATIECVIYTVIALSVIKLKLRNPVLPAITACLFGALAVTAVIPPSPAPVWILLAAGLCFAFFYSILVAPRLLARYEHMDSKKQFTSV